LGKGNKEIKRNIIKKDGFLYKTYELKYLLDDEDTIKDRISKINNFEYKKYKALTPTTIEIVDDKLVYKQPLYKIVKKQKFNIDDFFDLVISLNYLESMGFVHADLNKKNIIFTSEGFKIIDFEPSLYQIKNGVKQLMVTMPYVLKEELEAKEITITTDKLGFYYFLLRVTNRFSSRDVVALSKDMNHKKIIGINMEKFKCLTYRNILTSCYK